MRQSSRTVLTSCHAPLGQAKKYVAVQLLTKETLYCVVEVKSKAQQVLDQLGSYLGIKDICLFGLAFVAGDEYRFVNQNTKISKLAPKQWKSLSNTGLDGTGKPLVTFLLRIQFYVDCHLFIRDKVTRTHYYLQLRENVLKHSQSSLEEHYFLLCAYALQADIGNYSQDKYPGQYFEPKDYFPAWVLERIGEDYIIQNIPAMHKDNHGLSRSEAQTAFIRQASSADAPHNLHLYQLLKKKNDHKSAVWLGVCPKGIEIYENKNSSVKQLWSTFLWTNITKLYFEKKKFEIRAMSYSNTRKYTYYAVNDEKAKYLLHLCKMTHQFSMAMQPKVAELLHLEREAKKNYRESYIYSDSFDLEWEQEHRALNMSLRDFSTLPKAGKPLSDQRISVISNASSNTTSGIVSDKVQSLDGSEDDLEIEIMINSPPAPSLESLSQLDSEDFEAKYNLRRSQQSLQNIQSSEDPIPEVISIPSATHSKTSSNAVSRTDSSSSQHSASTIKSRHLQNTTNVVNIDEIEIDSKNIPVNEVNHQNISEISSSVYFLPKMEPVSEFLVSKTAGTHHVSNGSDSSESSYKKQKENSPVQVTFASAQKINPMQSATVQVCHPKPATSRILTSVGAQIPLIQPPNWNLQHGRTKIGVSSLSRPCTAGAVRPLNYFHAANNSLATTPARSTYQVPIQNNSLPTPLYHRYYELSNGSRGRSNSDDSFLISKPTFNNLENSFTSAQYDNYNDSIDGSDFPYIPPPPLYANPTFQIPNSQSRGMNFDLNNRVVQRARSEESCNSLEALMAQHNVHVGRAQSMDRRPKPDGLSYLIPPPSYGSKYRLEDKKRFSNLKTRTQPLDLDNLRRRSKDLDLPLIAALCNDRSLMPLASSVNQRRRSSESPKEGMVTPQKTGRPLSWHVSSDVQLPLSTTNSSSQWSLTPTSSIIKSVGKTALSPKSSPVNTLQGGPQLFPLKLSVSGYNTNLASRTNKLNGIDISVA